MARVSDANWAGNWIWKSQPKSVARKDGTSAIFAAEAALLMRLVNCYPVRFGFVCQSYYFGNWNTVCGQEFDQHSLCRFTRSEPAVLAKSSATAGDYKRCGTDPFGRQGPIKPQAAW